MPKELYDIRNYPKRSGTSQPQRHKPVLLGAEVKIDERTIADYIVFAQKLSKQLTFYNQYNIPQGTWEPFLQHDITYQLALLSSDKISLWNETWNELMEHVEGAGGAPAADDDHKKYFTWRFDFLYTLEAKLMEVYAFSNTLESWKNNLIATCSSAHLEIIHSLLGQYYTSATKFSLINSNAGMFSYKDITLVQKDIVDRQLSNYDPAVLALLEFKTPLFPDTDFIFSNLVNVPEQVAAASEYLNDLAGQLINIYSNVMEAAKKYLEITLSAYNEHQPHVGLFYAFLQLAEEHRNEINGLLLKHLDFYYKQVLLVKEKSWQPDQAFVTFELAKNVHEHFIPAGSLLSAGKDTGKKDIYYKTLQDILVNKAELSEVRSFTILKNGAESDNWKKVHGLFGCVAANTADGKGKPLSAGQSWECYRAEHTNAQQTGISFYSALLHEAPGETRSFELWLKLGGEVDQNRAATFIAQYGTVKILTEEEPIIFDKLADTIYDQKTGCIKIFFTISGKTKLSKTSPNASLIFGHKLESVDDSFFGVIEMFQTASLVNLHIVFSAAELKITQVETAAGKTDLSGAFAAFGGIPKPGSTFTVIEPLLSKRIAEHLKITVEWTGDVERDYSVSLEYGGNTIPEKKISVTDKVSTILIDDQSEVSFEENTIKVALSQSLGHDTFNKNLVDYILERIPKG